MLAADPAGARNQQPASANSVNGNYAYETSEGRRMIYDDVSAAICPAGRATSR